MIPSQQTQDPVRRIHLEIQGTVQGVGFRPFLHRLAEKYGLGGWARNTSGGVEVEAEGSPLSLQGFLDELENSPPPLACIEKVSAITMDSPAHYVGFSIRESLATPDATLISPDLSLCPDCAQELADPSNRRYRYPFLNCTNCGPRYTIVRNLPYDRAATSMAAFSMCEECRQEYGDIRNRRYHAQPDCCAVCGPRVFFLNAAAARSAKDEGAGGVLDEIPHHNASSENEDMDPFQVVQQLLADGGIAAIKGIGGIHLACDAENDSAVLRLRQRKKRPSKPLALMCRSMEEVRRICNVSQQEAALLESPRRPIVLLRKRDRDAFSAVSTGPRLGVMLPYTPLHVLLLDGKFGGPSVVVMTSANRSGCPVLIQNREAVQILDGIADGFLLHNRPIQNRCDDSVVAEWEGEAYFFRRSRGYAPQPLSLVQDVSGICAFGAEQKASFALGRGTHLFLSPHIGDLKNLETLDHYRETLSVYRRLFRIRPEILACDLHPDYFSTREAEELARSLHLPLVRIQHHWAHMASCMADNGLEGPVFGILWDGTGLGTDGTIWGGEFFKGGFEEFTRVGSIRPLRLAGGDRAVQEIGRIAQVLLLDAGLPSDTAPLSEEKRRAIQAVLDTGIACPEASSIGRLFDGVCSLLLQKSQVSYEGEGAALLEGLSPQETPQMQSLTEEPGEYPVTFYQDGNIRRFDTRPLIRAICSDRACRVSPGEIARRFMTALCRMALDQCVALNPDHLPVVLSGGVFQNRFLLSGVSQLLRQAGFSVFFHKRVSTGDEGLCLGQAAIACMQRRIKNVPCHSDEDYKN